MRGSLVRSQLGETLAARPAPRALPAGRSPGLRPIRGCVQGEQAATRDLRCRRASSRGVGGALSFHLRRMGSPGASSLFEDHQRHGHARDDGGTLGMKSAHEIGAINRFIAFLRETRGIDYRISAEDVVVDVATGSNYDYQLTAAGESAPALAV